MPRFLSVCLNPTFQRTVILNNFDVDEVNRATDSRLEIAGKGMNTTRVLHQLGADVRHLTHLGYGKELLLELCGQEGLDIVWAPSDSAIRTCITILDTATGSITEIVEPTEAVEPLTVDAVRLLYEQELKRSDWVIISGSKAPGYPDELFAEYCDMAHHAGVTIAVDYRGNELLASLKSQIAVVKINLVEFAQTFMKDVPVSEADDLMAIDAAVEKLRELSSDGCDYVITRGAREILFAHRGIVNTMAPPKIKPVNSIGSGDAFCAGLCFILANGGTLADAVREGARCGAANAVLLKPGTIK